MHNNGAAYLSAGDLDIGQRHLKSGAQLLYEVVHKELEQRWQQQWLT